VLFRSSPASNYLIRILKRFIYRIKCLYYRCEPDRFLLSELSLTLKNKLNIFFFDDVNSDSFYNILTQLSPDIIVIGGGWHQILSKRVFYFPPLGTLNTHPSLLPLYRGTSVHRWQIRDGVKISGVTIHYVDESFDTGPIIAQHEVSIGLADTPQSLFDKTARASADLMVEILEKISGLEKHQRLPVAQQDNAAIHYFHKWTWDDPFLEINWNMSFGEIYNFVRACHQESYQYKGPIFAFKNKKYFLRKSLLRINDQPNWTEKNGLFILKADAEGIHLFRKNDPNILVINQIQQYDKYYSLRRAFSASILVKKNYFSVGQCFWKSSRNAGQSAARPCFSK
jgi:methionyl-tRNA formyltransferase